MYLKRLVEFAEQQTNLPPIGYSRKEFHWIAIIDNNKLHFIKEEQQNKRIIPDKSRSSDIQPILLADKAEYVFGFTNKDSSDRVKKRLKQQHEAYLSLLEDCAKETNDRDIWNLYNILQKPLPNLPGKLKGSDIIIFRDPVETYLHEKETIQAYWKKKLQPDSNTVTKTRCMLCGTTGAVMERHTIEFPLKSQRTKLISADKPAYQSHGMKASTGSPICFMCEQKYGQALSYLLQNHSGKAKAVGPHMYPIQDITYVYWVRNKKQINFNNLFSISITTEKEIQ